MELDYKAIFRELNDLGIDYLVVGGLAVNLFGVPRLTYDIDLMILLEPDNIRKLITRLTKWGYKPKIPADPMDFADDSKRHSWICEKGMKAFNFFSENLPVGEIDIVIDSPIPYKALKERAVTIQLEEVGIPVVSIHDLVELKLRAGRKQDLSDIEYLKLIMEK
jgi:predicted nucleotidyltransferase